MTSLKAPKDKIFEKVINPYLMGVLQYPQSIEMREGMLHIRDVEGAKKTGSVETRLEAIEQQVFKCQGMVERGLNANHMMITEFTSKHRIDANDIGKHLSMLYDRIDHLQAQIYDLKNQNYEYEYRFKSIRLGADLRIPETHQESKVIDQPTSSYSVQELVVLNAQPAAADADTVDMPVVQPAADEAAAPDPTPPNGGAVAAADNAEDEELRKYILLRRRMCLTPWRSSHTSDL
ncbi:40S ribosomal protein S5-1 [Hordeum vulgare]|nr:40S ribosomal protein S5-1 [Hordeum vulgare]